MPVITISFMDDLKVMDKHVDDSDGNSCPLPTQDEELNEENCEIAIEEDGYRDADNGDAFVMSECCGKCAAYDITKNMQKCIGDDSGDTGYCQELSFVCSATYVCDAFIEGDPIEDDRYDDARDVF